MPTPPDVSGLYAWYKADHADLIALGDGGAVTTWPDSSGNGRDLTQSTAASKPRFKRNVIGGRHAVNFNTDDYMGSASSFTLGPFTVFVVLRDHHPTPSSDSYIYYHGDGTPRSFLTDSTLHDTVRARRGVTVSGKVATADWARKNRQMILTQVFGGTHASHKLYLDNVEVSLTAGTGTGDPGTGTEAQTFYVGGNNTGAFPLYGEIGEIIVYNVALSDADRTTIYDYLTGRFPTFVHAPTDSIDDVWNSMTEHEDVDAGGANPQKALRRNDVGAGKYVMQATDWADTSKRIFGYAGKDVTYSDAFSMITFSGFGASVHGGAFVRGSGTPTNFTGYVAVYSAAGTMRLLKAANASLRDRTGTGWTELGTFVGALSSPYDGQGDGLMLLAVGTTISVIEIGVGSQDCTTRISVTDSEISSGDVGAVNPSAGGGVNQITTWHHWEGGQAFTDSTPITPAGEVGVGSDSALLSAEISDDDAGVGSEVSSLIGLSSSDLGAWMEQVTDRDLALFDAFLTDITISVDEVIVIGTFDPRGDFEPNVWIPVGKLRT